MKICYYCKFRIAFLHGRQSGEMMVLGCFDPWCLCVDADFWNDCAAHLSFI